MDVLTGIGDMQVRAERDRLAGKTVGVVPTMGALHEGHLSLIRAARSACDVVTVTIFVNPKQFGPEEDFNSYPRIFDRDLSACENEEVDVVFAPEAGDMYPEGFSTKVAVSGLTTLWEGEARPGHFDGVTTVVTKLFAITKPHRAYFGQKDAQQVAVVRRMVRDLNFDLEIIVCPIVREADGLAMSSRNVYLLPDERQEALALFRSLKKAEELVASGVRKSLDILEGMKQLLTDTEIRKRDYIAIVNPDTMEPVETLEPGQPVLVAVAARVGATRLIDNTIVTLAE
ncbi:MAG: pantoate--beta-alanine ligase [Chlorobi bacterium]|nr:pantoate--beta-alanine ligase [Chlorobiota bacterium]